MTIMQCSDSFEKGHGWFWANILPHFDWHNNICWHGCSAGSWTPQLALKNSQPGPRHPWLAPQNSQPAPNSSAQHLDWGSWLPPLPPRVRGFRAPIGKFGPWLPQTSGMESPGRNSGARSRAQFGLGSVCSGVKVASRQGNIPPVTRNMHSIARLWLTYVGAEHWAFWYGLVPTQLGKGSTKWCKT